MFLLDKYLFRFYSPILSKRLLILLIGIGLLTSPILGQEKGSPFIRNYKPREFKASSANYSVVQDARGLMYFGNYRGVLEYDGIHWRLIPVSRQAQVRSMGVDSSGQVFVGALGEFGYLAPDEKGALQFHSLIHKLDSTNQQLLEPFEVLGANKGAWFRGFSPGRLFYWDTDSLHVFPVPETSSMNHLHYVHNQLYAVNPDKGLMRFNENAFELVPGGDRLKSYRLLSMVPLDSKRLLVLTAEKGFLTLEETANDIVVSRFRTELDYLLPENVLPKSLVRLSASRFLLGTTKSGLMIMNNEGTLIRQLDEQSGLLDNLILGAMVDRQQSLWMGGSKGISRVEINSPFSLWSEASGLKGIVFSTLRHKGTIYAATPLGVFYMEGDQFYPVKGINKEAWQLMSFRPGQDADSMLLVTTASGFFEIRNRRARLLQEQSFLLKVYRSPYYPNLLFNIAGPKGLQILKYENEKWSPPISIQGIKGSFQSMAVSPNGEIWLSEMLGKGAVTSFKLSSGNSFQAKSIRRYGIEEGLPSVNGIYQFRGDLIFASSKGLYTFQPETKTFSPDSLIGVTDSISETEVISLVEDQEGKVWMERKHGHNKWLELAIPDHKGRFLRDSVLLRGLADLEVWGNVYPEADGVVWIGTPEGLFRFDATVKLDKTPYYPPLIRKVVMGEDSLIFAGTDTGSFPVPTIRHDHNSLSFVFAAPYFEDESEVEFRYLLKGKDQIWSSWSRNYSKDYTLLPPGEYEFLVKARNLYGRESVAASFPFFISPPWYRSAWAFVLYGFILIFLIYGTVKLNTQRLHIQNEHLERVVYERTAEIWAQHKEIVKKTVALKRQKEKIANSRNLVEEKNRELEATLDKLKSTQTKLIAAEKMASLGQLTAGIAHEINNPINFVKGNINPIKRDFKEIKELFKKIQSLESEEDVVVSIQKIKAYSEEIDAPFLFEEMELLLKGIEEGAIRTKQIVDGLKVFSRTDFDTFKFADIHQGLDATLTILANKLKDRIKVHTSYGSTPVIECLPGKLNQVFLNIMSNAIQSIEKQAAIDGRRVENGELLGDLFISTKRTSCNWIDVEECIEIRIKDTGTGIDESTQKRIFDPFFTTKEIGEGTGLGLSISFGIVEKHHGKISVTSEKGKGAEFLIILPIGQKGLEIEE